jgi:hypothetical protein
MIFIGMKTCTRCHIIKPLTEFHKQRQKPDGYRPECKQCRSFDSTHYYNTHCEIVKGKWRKYLNEHPNYNRRYYAAHPEYFTNYSKTNVTRYKRWRKDHREHLALYRRQLKDRDPNFKVACALRSRVSNLIRKAGVHKNERSTILLGCSINDFRLHLESLFQIGMSWENYGRWHIDHIIPCSKFDLTKLEEQKKCFHYTNQQPLWAIDNLKKSNK